MLFEIVTEGQNEDRVALYTNYRDLFQALADLTICLPHDDGGERFRKIVIEVLRWDSREERETLLRDPEFEPASRVVYAADLK